jgi:septal ring-binding cell division protein DamX
MIPNLNLVAVALLIAVITHFVSYAVGHHEGSVEERDKAAQDRAVASALAKQAEANARAAGERFGAAQAKRAAEIKAAATERANKAAAAASKNVVCLSPAVVGALNDNPPAGSASEAATAEWVAHAQQAHQQCREQVINLGQWISTVTKGDSDDNAR